MDNNKLNTSRKVHHVLIDNCSLLQFVKQDSYNNYLSELENYINTSQVQLYTHEILIIEWNKHKDKRKRDKARKLLNENKKKEIDATEVLPENINNTSHLDSQTEQIDKIISNAVLLKTPEIIQYEFGQRYEKRDAPFHNKLDSQKDWYIIGSFCNYCLINGINEIVFISHNSSDFADLNNLTRAIHPTIQSRFPDLTINYYKNYSDWFKDLSVSDNYFYNIIPYNTPQNDKFTYKATIHKTVLESLDYIFNNLYNEIAYIPIHLLEKYYPFCESENIGTYYSNFTLSNISNNLYSFLESFRIEQEGKIEFYDENIHPSTDYINKLKQILKRLNQNLIYKLSSSQKINEINILYKSHTECDCCRCNFNKFKFNETFKKLTSTPESLSEKVLFAYINYAIGNIQTASKLYIEISDESYYNKNYILYFIAKYNLKHLSSFLNSFYFNKSKDIDLINKLKNIDPIEEAVKLKPLTDYNLLLFIAQEDYFYHSSQRIQTIVDKILEHYYSQLKGGWMSNNYVGDLITEFSQVERFINANFIVYDKYSDFESLFEKVLEGLFSSYAIKKSGGSRLVSLSDYWIQKILVYSKKETIIKYLRRFNIKKIIYQSGSVETNYFINISTHYFQNESSIEETLLFAEQLDNKYFIMYYYKIFENIVIMAIILDLEVDIYNKFAVMLLDFLKLEKTNNKSRLDSVKLFLKNIGRKLDKSIIYSYYDYFKNDGMNYDLEVFKEIIDCFEDNKFPEISSQEAVGLINNLLNVIYSNKHQSFEIIISIYSKYCNKNKEMTSIAIADFLIANFDFELFYLATIFDVIPFDEIKYTSLIDNFSYEAKNNPFDAMFKGIEQYHDDDLDKLLNIYFKENCSISHNTIERIQNNSLYYNWLMDMDNFNYEYFKPEWTLTHETKYYSQRMSKSEKLIDNLVIYCRNNSNSEIDKLLVRLTYLSKFIKD